MTYYHGFQQTQKSGLDKEMRLSVDLEFSRFVQKKNPVFTGKWLWLATKNISHLSGANATNKLFIIILIFLMNARPNPSRISFHGNTVVKNSING